MSCFKLPCASGAASGASELSSPENWQQTFCLEDWQTIKGIGSGGGGQITLVRNKHTGELKAMKTMRNSERNFRECVILIQINKLKDVNTTNLVNDALCDINDGMIRVLMSLAKTDLFNHITGLWEGRIHMVDYRCNYLQQILEGLCILHKLGIAHRDIKPENILMFYDPETGEWTLKLADLGLAIDLNGDIKHQPCGTLCYNAPEMLAHEEPGKGIDCRKGDVWSLAVVYYIMWLGEMPFGVASPYDVMFNKHNTNPPFGIMESACQHYRVDNDPLTLFVFGNMFQPIPAKRCSAADALCEVNRLSEIIRGKWG